MFNFGFVHNALRAICMAALLQPRVLVLAVFLSGFAASLSARAAPILISGDPIAGQTAYASACVGCHTGDTGAGGDVPGKYRLNASNATNVVDWVLNNQNMGGYAPVDPAVVANLAAYITQQATESSTASTATNTPITITIPDLYINDGGGYEAFTSITKDSGSGTLSNFGNAAGGTTATYTPSNNFTGTDTIKLHASGPAGSSSTRTITITVTANAPTVDSPTVNVNSDSSSNQIDLTSSIHCGAGDTCSGVSVTITLPITATATAHGTYTVAGNVVTYTPTPNYFGTDSFSYTVTGTSGGVSNTGTVTINVNALPTGVGAANMKVPLNTATSLDLKPFLTGTALTGINIVTAPVHGTADVNGTVVTYTPAHDYFGPDAFTYQAFGAGGTSPPPPAKVSVTVVGRPDPRQDTLVTGLINSQIAAAKRFAQAQIANFTRHMESLHHGSKQVAEADAVPGDDSFAGKSLTGKGIGNTTNRFEAVNKSIQLNTGQPLLANQFSPATSDANKGLQQPVAVNSQAELVNTVMTIANLAKNPSINLSSLSGYGVNESQGALDGIDIWVAGTAHFGKDKHNGGGALDFSTDGVSIGVDRRFGDQLTLGLGLGYAYDKSTLAHDGTDSKSRATSIAAYGSYQPTPETFVDALLGYGSLSYDTNRFVAAADDFAQANRDGDQIFGSLAAGYEYRQSGLLLSPYGRLDFAVSRLDAATENGAGLYALKYSQQTVRAAQLSLGLRAESVHQTSFGLVTPRARVELQHDIDGTGHGSIAYADLPGTSYSLSTATSNRNSLVLGVGSGFLLRNGLSMDIEYQAENPFGNQRSQSLKFMVTKELDGKGSQYSSAESLGDSLKKMGIRVDAGYTYDDNVSRAVESDDKIADQIYSINLSKNINIPLSTNTRLTLNGFAGGERFRDRIGLGRVFAGGQGEFQYRTSGEYGAPTFGIFGRITGENFQSDLRDGFRYSTGISARKSLTDRINLFSALAYNVRNASNETFDTKDTSLRLNLDYSAFANSTLYIGGEYRYGDIVSSGPPALESLDIAKSLVVDDVFTGRGFLDYRFRGRTTLSTLGYNLPLGPKDSIDISWRQARSTPSSKPGFVPSSRPTYVDNQFSIVYLVFF